jgi:hypothetical protein
MLHYPETIKLDLWVLVFRNFYANNRKFGSKFYRLYYKVPL